MSNGRHLPRPLFPLHKQLDRQRAVQRSISSRRIQPTNLSFVRKRVRISLQELNLFILGESTCH
jgi:hypothetical protein